MDIICFGQQNWDRCWTGKQQLMSRLASRGHRILYVDPSWSEHTESFLRHAETLVGVKRPAGLRRIGSDDLYLFTYSRAGVIGWRLNQWAWPRLLRKAAETLGFERPVALIHRPHAAPLLDVFVPHARVYYAVDEATAFSHVPEEEKPHLRVEEERLIRESDVALAISEPLQRRLRTIRPVVHLLPSAADLPHFLPESLEAATPDSDIRDLPHPRLGFVGQLDERLDQQLLGEIARRRPGWQIVLVGRVKAGVDFSTLEREPNVHFTGFREYSELPGVLREIDVCLAPYRLTQLTHASSPLKVYEYLATGKPVIASPVDGLRSCSGVVSFARGAADWIQTTERALGDPAKGREHRLQFAGKNDWEARTDWLEKWLGEACELADARRSTSPAAGRPVPRHGPVAKNTVPFKARYIIRTLIVCGRMYYFLRVAARALSGRKPVRVRRILVARRSRLGDTVVFLPTLAALRRMYPWAHIVLGVHPEMSSQALIDPSHVDEIRVLDFGSSRLGRAKMAVKLFLEGFDLLITGGRFFVMPEAFYSGAPMRVGLDDGHRWARFCNRRLRFDPTRHEAENNLRLLEALGARVAHPDRVPMLDSERGLIRKGDRSDLRELGVPEGAPVITIHPGAQKPSRRWPTPRFVELAEALLRDIPDLHIVLTGGPDEAPIVGTVWDGLSAEVRTRVIKAAGNSDLTALIHLLDQSRVFVCNDTGTMHVARARGTPLVALLGPQNDLWFGPHPSGPGPAIAFRHVVPCAPCHRWECGPLYCLRSLEVEEVHRAVRSLLEVRPAVGGWRSDDAVDDGLHPATNGWFPVVRQGAAHSWQSLLDSGFTLPKASLIIVSPSVRPEHSGAELSGPQVAVLEEALSTAARQTYPNREILLLAPSSSRDRLLLNHLTAKAAKDEPERREGFRVIYLDEANGYGHDWSYVLEQVSGDIVALLAPPILPTTSEDAPRWTSDKLGADVAALVRWPGAAAVIPRAAKEAPAGSASWWDTTFRKQTLQAELQRERTSGLRGDLFHHLSRLSFLYRKEPLGLSRPGQSASVEISRDWKARPGDVVLKR